MSWFYSPDLFTFKNKTYGISDKRYNCMINTSFWIKWVQLQFRVIHSITLRLSIKCLYFIGWICYVTKYRLMFLLENFTSWVTVFVPLFVTYIYGTNLPTCWFHCSDFHILVLKKKGRKKEKEGKQHISVRILLQEIAHMTEAGLSKEEIWGFI